MLLAHLSSSACFIAIDLSLDLNLLQGLKLRPSDTSWPLLFNGSNIQNDTSPANNALIIATEIPNPPFINSATHNEKAFECDGQAFGQPGYASCVNAYEQIPDNETVET